MKTESTGLAKANPEKASSGSPGAGSMPHLLGSLLGLRAGVDIKHVPYRGTRARITDLVVVRIAAAMNPSGDYLQYMKSGKVCACWPPRAQRSPTCPMCPPSPSWATPTWTSEEVVRLLRPRQDPGGHTGQCQCRHYRRAERQNPSSTRWASWAWSPTAAHPRKWQRPEGRVRALGAAGQTNRLHRGILTPAQADPSSA